MASKDSTSLTLPAPLLPLPHLFLGRIDELISLEEEQDGIAACKDDDGPDFAEEEQRACSVPPSLATMRSMCSSGMPSATRRSAVLQHHDREHIVSFRS